MRLDEFAPDERRGRGCGTCGLPDDLRAQVEYARASNPARFTYQIISKWLKTEGQEIHPDALRRHFNGGHHDQS